MPYSSSTANLKNAEPSRITRFEQRLQRYRRSALTDEGAGILPTYIQIAAVILMIIALAANGQGNIRYVIYAAPVLVVLALATSGRLAAAKLRSLAVVSTMLLILAVGALSQFFRSWPYIIFMGLPLFPLLFKFRFSTKAVDLLFFGTLACQIFYTFNAGAKFSINDFLSSTHHGETNTLPFVSGIFVGLYLKQKRRLMLILALLAVFAGGKRIGMLGATFGLFLQGAEYIFARVVGNAAVTKRFRYIVIIGIFVIGVAATLNLQSIFKNVGDKVGTDANGLSTGRAVGQQKAFRELSDRNLGGSVIGSGLGSADDIASESWNYHGFLIHNDYLRVMLDLGLPLGLLYLLLYLTILSWDSAGLYLACYFATLWQTDNTLIYAFVNMPLVCVLRAVMPTTTAPVGRRKLKTVRPQAPRSASPKPFRTLRPKHQSKVTSLQHGQI